MGSGYPKTLLWRGFAIGILILVNASAVSALIAIERVAGTVVEYPFRRQDCQQGIFPSLYQNPQAQLGSLLIQSPNINCLKSDGLSQFASSMNDVSRLSSLFARDTSNGNVTSYTIEFWMQLNANQTCNECEIMSIGSTSSSSTSPSNLQVTFSGSSGNGTIGFNGIINTPFSITVTFTTDSSASQDGGIVSKQFKRTVSSALIKDKIWRTNLVHVVILISSCYSVRLDSLSKTLVSSYSISPQVYINGVANSGNNNQPYIISSSFEPTSWTPSHHLNLLRSNVGSSLSQPITSTASPTSPSKVNLFYVAMYPRALSSVEILQNLNAGIPNSLPVVTSFTAIINEDGIVGNHYADPQYFSQPVPVFELASIQLVATDLDDTTMSPDYRNTSTGLVIQIVDVPDASTGGTLYRLDGTAIIRDVTSGLIGSTGLIYRNPVTGTYNVLFRPAWHQHSLLLQSSPPSYKVFTSFTYRAIDGITGLSSSDIASAGIIVLPVNQPPIPTSGLKGNSIAGALSQFSLSGSDIDSAITEAWITKLPSRGLLYRVFANGSISSTRSIVADTYNNATITCTLSPSCLALQVPAASGLFPLAYIFTSTQRAPNLTDSNGLIATDSFSFSLADEERKRSFSVQYTISIFTSILAIPATYTSTAPAAVENTKSPIKVYGVDKSSGKMTLRFKLIRSPTFGYLFRANSTVGASSSSALINGDLLSSTPLLSSQYSIGTSVLYQSPPRFFTYPSTTWNGTQLVVVPDSFDFVATTATEGMGGGTSSAQSTVSTQYIGVLNVNDPTEITFTYSGVWAESQSITIHALGSTSSSGDSLPSTAIIDGFKIIDPDRNVDQVRVQIIATNGGRLTLNRDAIPRLDFTSTRCRTSVVWQCIGSGYSETRMSFLAMPADVEDALNGLTYQSVKPYIVDVINITVFDGTKGLCVTSGSKSVFNGCFSRSVSFKVTVLGVADQETDTLSSLSDSVGIFGNMQTQLMILSALVLFSCCLCRCLCMRYCKSVCGLTSCSQCLPKSSKCDKDMLFPDLDLTNGLTGENDSQSSKLAKDEAISRFEEEFKDPGYISDLPLASTRASRRERRRSLNRAKNQNQSFPPPPPPRRSLVSNSTDHTTNMSAAYDVDAYDNLYASLPNLSSISGFNAMRGRNGIPTTNSPTTREKSESKTASPSRFSNFSSPFRHSTKHSVLYQPIPDIKTSILNSPLPSILNMPPTLSRATCPPSPMQMSEISNLSPPPISPHKPIESIF